MGRRGGEGRVWLDRTGRGTREVMGGDGEATCDLEAKLARAERRLQGTYHPSTSETRFVQGEEAGTRGR